MSSAPRPISTQSASPPAFIPPKSILEKRPPAVFASKLALREGNSKKPIYQIHKWWARRLGSVFRSILLGATAPSERRGWRYSSFYAQQDFSGLVVLDPFVGGGTTLVEAAKCNASVIGVDIDPVACFITSKELQASRESDLLKAFRQVEHECKDQLLDWYRTKLADGTPATTVYAFWVDLIKCPSCKRVTEAHPHYQLSRSRYDSKQIVFCSQCGDVARIPGHWGRFNCASCQKTTVLKEGPIHANRFTCPHCDHTLNIHSLVKPGRPLKQRMFALEVIADGQTERTFKKADDSDLRLYAKASRAWKKREGTDLFVPKDTIPIRNRVDLRPVSYGYRRYKDLFNDRQLLCLSILAKSIARTPDREARELLATAFSDSLAANNMFCFYAFDYQKLTPLFGLHAFHKVHRPVENNVWGLQELGRGSFVKVFNKLLRAKKYGREPFEYRYDAQSSDPKQIRTGEAIKTVLLDELPAERPTGSPFGMLLNQSSENLAQIADKSVDLILSDPPYYDNIAYSELSDFYHVWLKKLRLHTYRGNSRSRTPVHEALYVRTRSDESSEHTKFVAGLTKVLTECHRVLKDGGLFVFTFHHKKWSAWSALGSALFNAGFDITTVFPVRSEGRSQFHSNAGNLKWDAVFCCRKAAAVNPTRRLSGARSLRAAMQKARRWKITLKTEGLKLGSSDEESISSAFYLKACVNAGVDPREVAEPVFDKKRRSKAKTKK